MRNMVVLAILSFLAGNSHLALAQQTAPLGKVQTKPVEPSKEGTVNWRYWGAVTEITKDSITIEYWEEKKPKKFAVSETLAAGKVPKEPRLQPGQARGYFVSTPDMYRLSDVKVGDWVIITCARLGGVNICDHIRITKRPGGQVPPLPEEAERISSVEGMLPAKTLASMTPERLAKIRAEDAKRIRYHEQMNALWDLEDKGIPYPEKFGRDRRWPIAPMPRLRTLTTPNINP